MDQTVAQAFKLRAYQDIIINIVDPKVPKVCFLEISSPKLLCKLIYSMFLKLQWYRTSFGKDTDRFYYYHYEYNTS